MLGVIAHEMRTPITVARGNLDIVSRSLPKGKVDPIPHFLSVAAEAMDRLSRLTADLVEASRDEPPIEMSPLDLNDVVSQACNWLRPPPRARGSSSSAPARRPALVIASQDGLLSVLGNLLSNALRYTPAGGRVQASCRWTTESPSSRSATPA